MRKKDSVAAVSSQGRVTASDCRTRKMLIAVTTWSFHTVCLVFGSRFGQQVGRSCDALPVQQNRPRRAKLDERRRDE